MGGMIFEWDNKKAVANKSKHGISFEEAMTVFGDPLSLTIDDPLHSRDERRYVTIGSSVNKKILVVIHAENDDIFRIIGARLATPKERRNYEKT